MEGEKKKNRFLHKLSGTTHKFKQTNFYDNFYEFNLEHKQYSKEETIDMNFINKINDFI